MASREQIKISLSEQKLRFYKNGVCQHTYLISSAERGPGEVQGSEQTPRGEHYVRAKIGAGRPVNAVFIGRRFTGEIYSEKMKQRYPERDWILSRIIWLCGREVGKNRLGRVDSMRRYIYIHGTPDSEPIGVPKSHGCIRMRNRNVIELFELVSLGCPVEINER